MRPCSLLSLPLPNGYATLDSARGITRGRDTTTMRATHTDIDSYVDDRGKRMIRKSLSLNVTLRKEYISRIPRWRRPVVGYIFSFLLVGAALLGTLFIERMLQEHFHFLGSLFSVAVLFAALFWGT